MVKLFVIVYKILASQYRRNIGEIFIEFNGLCGATTKPFFQEICMGRKLSPPFYSESSREAAGGEPGKFYMSCAVGTCEKIGKRQFP